MTFLESSRKLSFQDKPPLKSGEMGESVVTAEICLPTEEASGVINCYKYSNSHCDKLLEAEYGFVQKWETLRGFCLRGAYTFMGFIYRNSTRFTPWKLEKDPFFALAMEEEEQALWKIPRVFPIIGKVSTQGEWAEPCLRALGKGPPSHSTPL